MKNQMQQKAGKRRSQGDGRRFFRGEWRSLNKAACLEKVLQSYVGRVSIPSNWPSLLNDLSLLKGDL